MLLMAQHSALIFAGPSSHRGFSVAGGIRGDCALRRRLGVDYTVRRPTCRCRRLPSRRGAVCTVTIDLRCIAGIKLAKYGTLSSPFLSETVILFNSSNYENNL